MPTLQSQTPTDRLKDLQQENGSAIRPLTGRQPGNSIPNLETESLAPEEKAALDTELSAIGDQIQSRESPIDSELEDSLEAEKAEYSAAGNLAYQTPDPGASSQDRARLALEALALDLGAEGSITNGTPILTGEKADELRSVIAAQTLAAQEAIEKAIKVKAKEQEQADLQADQQKQKPLEGEPLAVRLTDEQTRLLIANEYPNNVQAQNQAIYNITNTDQPVSVLRDTVNLDYSDENNTYFASLDKDAKPALDQKLTQLLAEQERKRQPPPQEREKSRQRERSKDYERE